MYPANVKLVHLVFGESLGLLITMTVVGWPVVTCSCILEYSFQLFSKIHTQVIFRFHLFYFIFYGYKNLRRDQLSKERWQIEI